MMGTSLSVIIPTFGRDSLRTTLRSYAHQMTHDDEIIVVGDTREGPLSKSEALSAEYGARYVDGGRGRCSWGHDQANIGFDQAQGDYLILNDDDDCATPNALADIRAAIAEQPHPRPLLFQFMAPWREVLWDRREIVETRIGGHCLVQPNVPGKVAYMTPRYSGDFDQIVRAAALYDGDVAWVEKLIAWTRPTPKELARLLPGRGVA